MHITFNAPGWTGEQVAHRVADLLIGHDPACPPYLDGMTWKLDAGNNWFLYPPDGVRERWDLTYRYAAAVEPERRVAIVAALRWLAQFDDVTIDADGSARRA